MGKNKNIKKYLVYFCIELGLVALYIVFDLLTKHYIYGSIKKTGNDIVLIKNILKFTAVENTGASFGMLSNSTLLLTYFSLFSVIIVFFLLLFTTKDRSILLRASLILILAGGIGNLIDRFKYSYVRDFVYFEVINFPVFNFADSALTVGSILAIIWVIFVYSKKIGSDKNNDK